MASFKLTTDHLHGRLLLPGHGKKGSVQMVRSTKDGRVYLQGDSLSITAEDGSRFLMDHINGDTYYHIYYPRQNLDRSRT